MLAVERLITGCGNAVALHEALGEVLGTFEYGTCLGGSDHGHVLRTLVGLEFVVDALYQRVFRTYHHHVDALFGDELLDGLEVVGLHGDILAAVACARIAWGDIQFVTFLTLSDFPCEGVLTAAAA